MVPEEFHDFFVASAGVAGALIGLLFVAISVHPEQIGQSGNAAIRFRPSAALSALSNALAVSLLLLIPDLRPGPGVVIVGAVGLVAVVTLLIGLVPEVRGARRSQVARATLLLVGQGVAFGYEVANGVRIWRGADPDAPLRSLCVLVLILFLIGIERAWEFVGASMPSLAGTVWSLVRPSRRSPR